MRGYGKTRLFVYALVVAGIGCGGVIEEDPSARCTGAKCDEATPASVIAAPQLAKCWIAAGNGGDALLCQYAAPAGIPITTQNVIASGQAGTRGGKADHLEAGGVAKILDGIGAADYPIQASVEVTFTSEISGMAATTGNVHDYRDAFNIASAQTFTEAAPKPVKLPFDLWKLNIDARMATTLTIAPYTIDFHPTLLDNNMRLPVAAAMKMTEGQQVTIFLPVDAKTTSLGATLSGGGKISFEGPGEYVLDETGLHVATGAIEQQQPTSELVPSGVKWPIGKHHQ